MMRLIFNCVFSPRLYRIYGQGPGETCRVWMDSAKESGVYESNMMEKVATHVISAAQTIMNVSIYTSPFICMYIYKRGFFSSDETRFLLYMFGAMGCLLSLSLFVRSLGRASNPQYVDFLHTLYRPVVDNKAYIESIRKYDFDFKDWPVSYAMPPIENEPRHEYHPFHKCANPELPYIKRVTIQILAYLAIHTFALRLIYPGCLSVIQNMLWAPISEGRLNLVEVHNGKRARVITADKNNIDTMFVDNRLASPKGNILVICSEGNSGFYEIGIMATPIKAGYSALGWNHPGFAASTGVPFPRQEQNAIDAVVQYAIQELNFNVEDIVMFGWSIGGYAATWAAVAYPDIKGLILDASFDDLLPLAVNQMPRSWNLLVKEVVRSYMDLNVADLLVRYSGPVQLVRRTEDEVICLRAGQLSTNRGNMLFLRLVLTRHPEFFDEVNGEKPVIDIMQTCVALSDQQRIVLGRGDLPESKRRILQMIERYMRDYRSTHCTPLPDSNFTAIMDSLTNN